MKHVVNHDLDMPTAKRVAESAWASYSERFQKYDPTINWVSEEKAKVGFNAKGITLDGELELKQGSIAMDLDVPFILRPFKKKALSVIDQEIRSWIAKAKAGEI